jgi:N-acetylglucosamine-6-sulfatase
MSFTLDYENFDINANGKVKRVKHYYTTAQSRQARSFINSARGPLFLYLSSRAPHGPSTPEKRFAGDYRGTPVEFHPARNEADVSDKPAFVRNSKRIPDRWIRS